MTLRTPLPLLVALLALAAPAAGQSEGAVGPVAARDLDRGVVLEAADVVGGEGEGAREVVGWVTRRVVSEGEPLRRPAIAPPDVIRSGDTVQLVWSDGALELRLRGRAMASAAAGEKVLVRVDTQRRFEGIAQASGEVRLVSPE